MNSSQALALLATLNAACHGIDDLGQAAAEAFQQHPDHAGVAPLHQVAMPSQHSDGLCDGEVREADQHAP